MRFYLENGKFSWNSRYFEAAILNFQNFTILPGRATNYATWSKFPAQKKQKSLRYSRTNEENFLKFHVFVTP